METELNRLPAKGGVTMIRHQNTVFLYLPIRVKVTMFSQLIMLDQNMGSPRFKGRSHSKYTYGRQVHKNVGLSPKCHPELTQQTFWRLGAQVLGDMTQGRNLTGLRRSQEGLSRHKRTGQDSSAT